jgi:hypothetical protein
MDKHHDGQALGAFWPENVQVKTVFAPNEIAILVRRLRARRGKVRTIAAPIGGVLWRLPAQVAERRGRVRQPIERLDRSLVYANHITILGVRHRSIGSKGFGSNRA